MRRLTIAAIATSVVASLAWASAALANGRFPATNQIVVGPSDPNVLVLRTTFGILQSKDRGQNWDWICERAVGYGSTTEDPSLGLTASNTILAGTFEGLAVSPDTGCSWAFAGGELAKKVFIDVTVRPDAPHTALALTNKYVAVNDAGDPLYSSQIYVTTNDGADWAAFGSPIDPTAVLETLEVAASDLHRVYVSGFRGTGATLQGLLFESTDDGVTWTPHAIPLEIGNDKAAFIAAVDPTNADRVYVRTDGTSSSRLLVTDDHGATFTPRFTATQLAGFALSADGSKVYVGGPKDGLQVASTADFQFHKKSNVAVQCLRTSGTTLYICSNEVSGFIVGTTDDDGTTLVPKLHLDTMRGPISCPPSATASECGADWQALKDNLGIPSADAGPNDAGAGDAGPGGGGSSKGCGCRGASVSGGDAAMIAGLAAALGLAGVVRKRAQRARGQKRRPSP